MTPAPRSAMTVTHRRYVPFSHAHYAGNLVDGAYSLAAFGDVATEMCIRTDGDEGLFASYSDVQFRAPVRAGDVIEISATPRAGRTPFAGDGVRGAGRRPRGSRARRVRRRRARPAPRGDHRPRGRRGAAGRVKYRGRVPTPLRYAARPAAAVAAGLCLWLAFPETDLWWLAPVGVALLAAATLTAGAARGAGLGMLAGPRLLRARRSPGRGSTSERCRGSPWRRWRPCTSPPCRPSSGTPGAGSPRRAPGRRLRCWSPSAGCPGVGAGRHAVRRLPLGPPRLQPGRQPPGPRRPAGSVRRGSPSPWRSSAPLLLAAAFALAGPPRRPPSVAGLAVAVAVAGPWRLRAPARRTAARVGRLRAGQRPRRPAWTSTPSAAPCWTTTSAARRRSRRRAPERPDASSCGRRTPRTSTPSATPTPPPQIERARAAVGVPLLIGAVLAEPVGRELQRLAVLPAGGHGPAALRQAAPGAVRRVHPRTAPSSGSSRRWPTWRATSSPATGSASSGCRRRAATTSRCRRSASRWPTTG